MESILKNYILLFSAAASLLSYSHSVRASETDISAQRQQEIAKVIFENQAVKPYQELAETKTGLTSADLTFKTYVPVNIDCSKPPLSYGRDLAPGYCEITAFKNYGWHADQLLVIVVRGYIKKEKIQSGEIIVQEINKTAERSDKKDLTISAVTIETPVATNLE